jgi:signal peptidase II
MSIEQADSSPQTTPPDADAAAARPAAEAAATPSPPADLAWRSPAAWIILLGVLAGGLIFDLRSKEWAFENVIRAPDGTRLPVALDREELLGNPRWRPPHHDGVHILPWSLLDLRLVVNHGAVFGIGANRRIWFIVFTLGALAAGLYLFAFRTRRDHSLAHVSLALILAGGLGNLYDRIVYGVVRDFLHMLPGWHMPFGWHYPRFMGGGNEVFPWVFNGADVMLLTGMGLLLLHLHRLDRARKTESPVTQAMTASSD